MTLDIWQIIGATMVLALIVGVGIYSGSRVKNGKDFTTGGHSAGAWVTAGVIMGSLVSGQATIGTAQLAYSYGMAAWWFTLGAGIGCLILGITYVVPMRRGENATLIGIISDEYGPKAGYIASILSSLGTFISIIAQVLSACALFTTVFPVSAAGAAVLAVILMMIYVGFGGIWGAGMSGVVKLVLLYGAVITGCILVLGYSGGLSPVMEAVGTLLAETGLGASIGITDAAHLSQRFLNLTARGVSKDVGSGLSLLLGVLSTQTYAQAIWSSKSNSAARKGAFLSALLIPPIGLGCILIGLFMRGHSMTTAEIELLTAAGEAIPEGIFEIASEAQAFPMFVMHYLPPLLGGIVIGAMLITIVGGGAGLSLGVAAILVNDILVRTAAKEKIERNYLRVSRIVIAIILAAAAVIAVIVPGAIINDFGFLSMGLRGTVVFLPMTGALFLHDRIDAKWATVAVILGPLAVLSGNMAGSAIDPLFIGAAVSLICMAGGLMAKSVKSK